MNIGVVGMGKLGFTCALAIESKGHTVKGFDISDTPKKILETKQLPFLEHGAQELLDNTKIEMVPIKDLVQFADIIFVAVQTPHDKEYEGITRIPDTRKDFNYTYLVDAVKGLSEEIERQKKPTYVVVISTVLPTTMARLIQPILSKYVKFCYNPYFIAMSTTIRDFLHPEFVLFGIDDKEAVEKAKEFYRTINPTAPFFETTIPNAELIKVLYNTLISTKLAFINTAMMMCEEIPNTNVDEISNALALGFRRITSDAYMYAGMGDAGSCHPRDNIALSWLSRKLKLKFDFFSAIMQQREIHAEWFADIIEEYHKKTKLPITVLGYAYKPNVSLEQGSHAKLVSNILKERGVEHNVLDPHIDDQKKVNEQLITQKRIYFIGMKHDVFERTYFKEGSIVIDPFRFIHNQQGVELRALGKND